uniref:Uncharacterized protein n=1 Tax=Meloidogyne incognita TaxID=6306 RepID=A0A914NJK5_MELIC
MRTIGESSNRVYWKIYRISPDKGILAKCFLIQLLDSYSSSVTQGMRNMPKQIIHPSIGRKSSVPTIMPNTK